MESYVELFNSTDYQVDNSDETPPSKDLWATLSMQLQMNSDAPLVDRILAEFPIACSLTTNTLQPELVSKDTMGEQCTSAVMEQDSMDKLSQLIMSVNLQLD